MFDTMTMVKTLGALCGALLIFLLGGWFAETVYHAGSGGHHGEEHAQGYLIDVGGATEGDAVAEEVDFATMVASADPAKGEKIFKKCSACHSVEPGKHGVGPSLGGVVGRAAGGEGGFSYSGSFDGVVDNWTPEHLNEFLTKPAKYTPGTTMGFAGLPKAGDRAAVVAYLQGLSG